MVLALSVLKRLPEGNSSKIECPGWERSWRIFFAFLTQRKLYWSSREGGGQPIILWSDVTTLWSWRTTHRCNRSKCSLWSNDRRTQAYSVLNDHFCALLGSAVSVVPSLSCIDAPCPVCEHRENRIDPLCTVQTMNRGSVSIFFHLKSKISSIVLVAFWTRLFFMHHTASCSTSSQYTEMSLAMVVSPVNMMMLLLKWAGMQSWV